MLIEQSGGATGWPQSPGSVFQAHLHVTHFSFWEKESKKWIIDFFFSPVPKHSDKAWCADFNHLQLEQLKLTQLSSEA